MGMETSGEVFKMKSLKILSVGIVVWGLMLLWPEVNLWLTPPVMIALMIGLSAISFAYFLGLRFGQPENNGNPGQSLYTPAVQPATSGRRNHSRPTLPLRTTGGGQKLHSRPTRPI
jgi:hypothetical protein